MNNIKISRGNYKSMQYEYINEKGNLIIPYY